MQFYENLWKLPKSCTGLVLQVKFLILKVCFLFIHLFIMEYLMLLLVT